MDAQIRVAIQHEDFDVAREIEALGRRSFALAGDLADEAAVRALLAIR